MRRQRYVLWTAVLLAAVGLAACSADPTATPTTAPPPTATPTTALTPEATPTAALPEGAVRVDLAASQDATLYEDDQGLIASGAGEHLFVGLTNQPGIRRSLIAFDLSAVPTDARIHSVELTLTLSRTGLPLFANPIALHRATASWGEGATDPTLNEGSGEDALPGDATWVHRTFDDQPWATPGGDFAPDASATTEVGRLGPYTWGPTDAMVADVQAWLDDPGSNRGWALVGDEVTRRGVKRFDSRQRADETKRPVLLVVYVSG